MLYKSAFRENVQSQALLEKLASLIMDECVARSIDIIKKRIITIEKRLIPNGESITQKDFESELYPVFFPVSTHNMEYTKNKFIKDLKPFMTDKDKWIRVEFLLKEGQSTRKGQYRHYNIQKGIDIFIDKDDYDEAVLEYTMAYATEDFPINATKFRNILLKYERILVHELQHYYDDLRSEGKYEDSNYSNDSSTDAYWKSPVEVSARYADTVRAMKDLNVFYSTKWNDVVADFKYRFRKWELLDRDVQERLIKRLSQEYQEVQKQFKKPTVDITKSVEKLQNQFDRKQVELRYRREYDLIEIYRLKTDSIKEDEDVLKLVIKLAETYRHIVAVLLDKEYFTGIGQTTSLLKKYGFKPNYGGKTNYQFNVSKYYYVRYPKRK